MFQSLLYENVHNKADIEILLFFLSDLAANPPTYTYTKHILKHYLQPRVRVFIAFTYWLEICCL
jgi:hypothetical protein